jgi:hypothetical protein
MEKKTKYINEVLVGKLEGETTLEKRNLAGDWIHCVQNAGQNARHLKTKINNSISYIVGTFLTRSANVSCIKRAKTCGMIWRHSYSEMLV